MFLWGGPAQSSPLYHYGFEAGIAFLRLRGCCLQLRSGHAVRAALAIRARMRANSDSHFFGPASGLLCAISCIAAGKARWTVPNPGIDDLRRLSVGGFEWARALARCWGCNRLQWGDAQHRARNYAMRTGYIGVTQFDDKSEWQCV